MDLYRQLPRKTLQLLQYAAASPCDFTHMMKVRVIDGESHFFDAVAGHPSLRRYSHMRPESQPLRRLG